MQRLNHPMANMNTPRIVSADKLTEAELDAAIANGTRAIQAPPKPLPPMDFRPAWYEVGHCASEVDDDEPEPMTQRTALLRALVWWGSLVVVIGGALAAVVL